MSSVSSGNATPANLNGNWLLAGTLPTNSLVLGQTAPFGFAMSFTTTGAGDQILGSGSMEYTCGGVNSGFTLGALVKGSVAADGSFTAQNVANPGATPGVSIAITGKVPATPQAAWSGTYTVQATDPATLSLASCTFSQSSSFTAAPVQNVTGRYVGTGSIAVLGEASTPVTVTVNLQQGGTVPSSTGTATYDALLVSGTIEVAGSPCFRSGSVANLATTPAVSTGGMEGNHVVATFNMDDGSRLVLDGSLADLGATRIVLPLLVSLGGTCEGQQTVLRISELDKVS